MSTARTTRTIFTDDPKPWWVLALLFVLTGTTVMLIGMVKYELAAAWEHGMTLLFGTCSLAAGLTIAWSCPLSKTLFDPRARTLMIVRTGLFGRRTRVVALKEIDDISVERMFDDQGNPTGRPVLLLRNGNKLPLSSIWLHNLDAVDSAAAQLGLVLRGRVRDKNKRIAASTVPHKHRYG